MFLAIKLEKACRIQLLAEMRRRPEAVRQGGGARRQARAHQPRRLAGQRLQLPGAALAPALRLRGAGGVPRRRSRTSTAPATRAAELGTLPREPHVPDNDRVERLLAAMTLEEKLGQLNMIDASAPPDGREVEMERQIAAGAIGSLLNIHGAETTERAAAHRGGRSRLRIPLIFGLDVLHGHRTIFPIPLAEAGAFDPESVGAHRAGVGRGGGPRRHHADLRADARRVPRSALGPHRRRPRRGPLGREPLRRGQGARLPGHAILRRRRYRRDRQASRRLWRGGGGPRLRLRRRLRAPAR